MLAAFLDGLDRAAMSGRNVLGALKDLSEADDGGERRAQFVAHEGKETAFGLISAVGGDARLPQLGVAPLDLRKHVVEGVNEHAHLVVGLFLRAHGVVLFLGNGAGRRGELQERIGNNGLQLGGNGQRDD